MSDVEHIAGEDNIEINTDGGVSGKIVEHSNNNSSTNGNWLKLILSTPSLVFLVVLYSIMGAVVFPMLEAPRDAKNNAAVVKSREDCLKELWTITEKLNVLYERNWTMLVHEQLRRFEGSIVAATRNGNLPGLEIEKSRWSFSEALLYSITVITTIGHGNLTPKTSAGKIATILYALIGVPLMLMCLSSLGGLLAEALQCTYTRFCCSMRKRRRKDSGGNANCITSAVESSAGDEVCPCNRESHEMNCKTCKYDAIISESKHHNSYHEYTSVGERDDSCHLLNNSSPNKVNQSPTCRQLKTYPAIKQYCNRNQDISPLKHNQQQQQQQQQPPIQSHFQQQSPKHHGIAIMFEQKQQQSQQQQQQQQPIHYQLSPSHNYQQTSAVNCHQNGVEIASGVTDDVGIGSSSRRSSSALGISGDIGGVNTNCITNNCCPDSTGTATIYFPVPTSGNHISCNSTLHYNQPLVKYHTIQLQQLQSPPSVCPPMQLSSPLLHTATIHGICRGKFVSKPMPQEINALLAENDVSCNRYLLSSTTNRDSTNSSTSVDIMEDEEENERNRIGCSHGTPSRVPLISAASPVKLIGNKSDNQHVIRQQRQNLLVGSARISGSCKSNPIKDNAQNPKAANKSHDRSNGSNDHNDDDDENIITEMDDDGPHVPITIVLLILVSYICLGTVIFAFWENWSLIDGAYFCFVTLSTIGYGDFLPEQSFYRGPDIQLFACCAYLLLGLVLVAMAFSILETQLLWKCKRIAVRLKLAKETN